MRVSKSDPDLESLVRRVREGEIDLQPDFQRDEIWNNERRQRLVDSILRNWYVPAVHIVQDLEGNQAVLDGQQRLAAVRDFFADRLKINGHTEPPDEKIRSLHGMKYSTLPQEIRRSVNNFSIAVITLSDHSPQEPNELFFRLNQAYNLTPPEKRNALHGTARNQVRSLVEELKQTGFLTREKIGFSNSRLGYDDVIARTCVALEINDMKQHINNSVVETYYRTQQFTDKTLDLVRRASSALLEQIDSTPDRVRFNKGTLQTWLIYSAWVTWELGSFPENLLAHFESLRSSSIDSGSNATRLLIAQYEDRASYRVTDVSSVLTRDLAIHLVARSSLKTPERLNSDTLLETLQDSAPEDAQGHILDFLAASGWGNPITRELSE
ncbi:DUF262 domain-containing protein [Timonella senegalensis]|uniref:DUF262 domain-containing protein n=1 Tax=Timonella senegalensis TaxID=1465825 RepID=UPI0028AE9D59|nr:DUF262 domain-containing protein [Timonella senegalensis]